MEAKGKSKTKRSRETAAASSGPPPTDDTKKTKITTTHPKQITSKNKATKTDSKAKVSAKKARSGPLEVGEEAPDFKVKDQTGREVTLEEFNGSKNVVVYFYPKDNTPGCSKEACKFRDLKKEYDELDCVVLGVSADHETSHEKFIAKFNLNFSLLADTNRELIKSYGASKAGDKIQRSTVLIDKEGKVAAVWNPVKGAEQHPVQVLDKLRELE